MATGTRTTRTADAGRRPRFARSTQPPPGGRFPRLASTPARTGAARGLRRRREPEPSGLKKLAGALQPLAAAAKATPSSKKGKAGGLALVATAAGMVFKNRDKLAGMRRKDSGTTAASANNASTATPHV